MTWRATVLTIFPEMLPGPLAYSLAGKALKAGIWRLETVDIRDFARDKHRSVDDAPFGGGPGMVMRPDVLDAAIAGAGGPGAADAAVAARPAARPGERSGHFADGPGVTLVCGRFEGVDERVIEATVDRGGQPRRLRAVGRRAGGDRADRRLRAAVARGRRVRRGAGRRRVSRRAAGIPALHPAAGVARAGGAGGAGVRRSPADPRMAAGSRRSG